MVNKAINPNNGRPETYTLIHNYFGDSKHGVRFDDGSVWPESRVEGLSNINKSIFVEL
jgi:hypothetical protein